MEISDHRQQGLEPLPVVTGLHPRCSEVEIGGKFRLFFVVCPDVSAGGGNEDGTRAAYRQQPDPSTARRACVDFSSDTRLTGAGDRLREYRTKIVFTISSVAIINFLYM